MGQSGTSSRQIQHKLKTDSKQTQDQHRTSPRTSQDKPKTNPRQTEDKLTTNTRQAWDKPTKVQDKLKTNLGKCKTNSRTARGPAQDQPKTHSRIILRQSPRQNQDEWKNSTGTSPGQAQDKVKTSTGPAQKSSRQTLHKFNTQEPAQEPCRLSDPQQARPSCVVQV